MTYSQKFCKTRDIYLLLSSSYFISLFKNIITKFFFFPYAYNSMTSAKAQADVRKYGTVLHSIIDQVSQIIIVILKGESNFFQLT